MVTIFDKQGQEGQYVHRVDRRTNALPTDRQTDRPTDRPTDTASYRGALSHLKRASSGGRETVSLLGLTS